MRDETVSRKSRAPSAGAERADEGAGGGGEEAREESAAPKGTMPAGELQRRRLLGPRVKGMLVITCKVIEKVERLGM